MQLVLQLGQVLFLKSKRDTCLSEKERALVCGFPKFLLIGILPLSHDWACLLSHLSRVRLFLNPWTVAHHVPLSAGLSRQEYWSGLPFPSPGDLPDPGIKPPLASPALQSASWLLSHLGSPSPMITYLKTTILSSVWKKYYVLKDIKSFIH